MKKIIIIILSSILSTSSFGNQNSEKIEVIGRIKAVGNSIQLLRSIENDIIPSVLGTPELETKLAAMEQGDEAIVSGHITQVSSENLDGQSQYRPVFIIDSIRPISLKRLGKMDHKKDSAFDARPLLIDESYHPYSIPVSAEIAKALTLSTSVLLMQSLTSSASRPGVSQQLDSGVIIFAGLMATGVFIYEQITSSKSK